MEGVSLFLMLGTWLSGKKNDDVGSLLCLDGSGSSYTSLRVGHGTGTWANGLATC